MNDDAISGIEAHLEDLLNLPRQVWLLGAGISRDAGVPLMSPLTDRVVELLADDTNPLGVSDTTRSAEIFNLIRKQLSDNSHVEHILSQIGDFISLAERQKDSKVLIEKKSVTAKELRDSHHHIQLAIRHTVEYGYIAATDTEEEKIGKPGASIVHRDSHDDFIRSLFHHRRAGLEQNPPVKFFTTNYDTLLEDSLAHHCIAYVDGFSGGATGFWDLRNSDSHLDHASRFSRHTASVAKLHGSIDWVSDDSGVVMRVRSSVITSDTDCKHRLLIYPQATKYHVTQRDPFASLFGKFRSSLDSNAPTVLIVCGYSFGDDHINEEIERALRTGPSTLTVLALCHQAVDKDGNLKPEEGLPTAIAGWLKHPAYAARVIVGGSCGYYRGCLTNSLASTSKNDWWTFSGIAKMLAHGVEIQR